MLLPVKHCQQESIWNLKYRSAIHHLYFNILHLTRHACTVAGVLDSVNLTWQLSGASNQRLHLCCRFDSFPLLCSYTVNHIFIMWLLLLVLKDFKFKFKVEHSRKNSQAKLYFQMLCESIIRQETDRVLLLLLHNQTHKPTVRLRIESPWCL